MGASRDAKVGSKQGVGGNSRRCRLAFAAFSAVGLCSKWRCLLPSGEAGLAGVTQGHAPDLNASADGKVLLQKCLAQQQRRRCRPGHTWPSLMTLLLCHT
jgi:hypothetical protein